MAKGGRGAIHPASKFASRLHSLVTQLSLAPRQNYLFGEGVDVAEPVEQSNRGRSVKEGSDAPPKDRLRPYFGHRRGGGRIHRSSLRRRARLRTNLTPKPSRRNTQPRRRASVTADDPLCCFASHYSYRFHTRKYPRAFAGTLSPKHHLIGTGKCLVDLHACCRTQTARSCPLAVF